jgi:dihydroxyacetone kinase-like predicted kinase
MQKYFLEFILNTRNATPKSIKNSLTEFGENLEIIVLPEDTACVIHGQAHGGSAQDESVAGDNLKIKIHTQDPTIIFDICAQFGRLKSVKID